ncbi:chorismate-binding protein [Pseudooceanicola sp. LIPI14-2-Ac024]|uniref:chorismate-binding protein n=1 Tax=Pseudooceanicola sp. LIPI14-2-Ac024 TaxID=3344875 RepID=UPI0035D05CF7
MTSITQEQRAACAAAQAEGLPFAIYREPHGSAFTAVVATAQPVLVPIFGSPRVPGFVMCPFRTEDGAEAWLMPADVLVTSEGPVFRDGTTFAAAPVTEDQRRITAAGTIAPLRASADADAPAPTPRAAYEARVARAVAAIKAGGCDKIVLSRIEPRDLKPEHDLCALAEALGRAHPHAFVSLVSSSVTGTWLTATPEVLLSVDAQVVRTMALAGTQWPAPGTDLATLQWPQKIIDEQALVADFIRDAFAAEGIGGVEETAPGTVQAANLCHLRSDFEAPAANPVALAGLLRRLHPTSAVCGMPRAEAHAFILEEEGDTRSFYTGYLGPVNLEGRTALYVNLRSARVAGNRIFLHVGGGIVAASDPALEWEETVEKTRTIAQVL